jgi:CopG family nickel-responsive transcriptional regulator
MSLKLASFARLSVSLPTGLSSQLDAMVAERGLAFRSQLIAELIRHALADHYPLVDADEMLAGTITLIYCGEHGRLRRQLSQTQASYLKEIIASQHVVLEDNRSLEVLLVQGPAVRLRELCDAIRKVRGVQQLELVTTFSLLPPLHDQGSSQDC